MARTRVGAMILGRGECTPDNNSEVEPLGPTDSLDVRGKGEKNQGRLLQMGGRWGHGLGWGRKREGEIWKEYQELHAWTRAGSPEKGLC